MSQQPTQSTIVDAAARFGVPAVICFVLLFQLNPRLDRMVDATAQTNTQLAVLTASCFQAPAR